MSDAVVRRSVTQGGQIFRPSSLAREADLSQMGQNSVLASLWGGTSGERRIIGYDLPKRAQRSFGSLLWSAPVFECPRCRGRSHRG